MKKLWNFWLDNLVLILDSIALMIAIAAIILCIISSHNITLASNNIMKTSNNIIKTSNNIKILANNTKTYFQIPPESEFWMTGYTAEEGFTTEDTTTSNGTPPDYGTVACDPSYIPYGSIIYWKEYSDNTPGNHYGKCLDSGSAVIGAHLDWWYLTNEEAAKMTKTATVQILRLGWYNWLVDPGVWGLDP